MTRLILRAGAAAALAFGAFLVAPSELRAEGLFCAQESGRGGYTNCGYYTFSQCLAATSGVGGYCMRNPAVRAYSIEEAYVRPRRVIVYRY